MGCVLFLAMMVLLTIQVCSRYLGNAITWTEELSCIMLVWMSYLGFAGAITSRKHLRIDAFINSRSFKVKKILLIVSNVINALFSAALIVPMYRVIVTFHASAAASRSCAFQRRFPSAFCRSAWSWSSSVPCRSAFV